MRKFITLLLVSFAIQSQFYVQLAECNKTPCMSQEYAEKHLNECANKRKGLLDRAKFEDWSKWSLEFPMCDSTSNPNLSPVNILTENVIPVKDELPLIIYSGPPQTAMYFYSTEYIHDGVMIQAVNLHSRKENFRDITYIAGVGNTDYRYFQNAMFLFTINPVESQRSFHQIDGKKFMLEIVLTFADIPRSGELPSDTTQIHVMVEKSEVFYPGWKFLEEGILGITSLSDVPIDATDQVLNAKEDFNKASKKLAKLKNKEKEELGADTYSDLAQDLKKLYRLVERGDKLEQLAEKDKQLKVSIQDISAEVETIQKRKTEIQSSIDSVKEEITREIAAGIMLTSDQNEKTDKIEKLNQEIAPYEKNFESTLDKLHKTTKELWKVSDDLKKTGEVLRRYHIGTMEGAKFQSITELKEKLDTMKTKAEQLERAERNMVSAKDSLETMLSQSARDVLIANTPFQISWLFPSTGGYYRYNGSSVVPPCSPRTRVIVMEKSIPMSQEQFTAISNFTIKGRFQSDFDNQLPPQPMDNAIPIMRNLGNRQIFFNRKNIEFKLDDAMHMQSKLRRRIKDSMKISGTDHVLIYDKALLIIIPLVTALFALH